ncbi:hypothetical protein BZG36_00982 [Bifiguratus adelaidae]|uniref:UBX domain-containing protein n=1 Tax=Bifiguratus adelaidae TaxID=1938954 RepID=A0A261Y699_9FUNG|nr:hypothetical protein BZG36_00982 [Bifiguratus adelaidae]
MDDSIQHFSAITGADPDIASKYLKYKLGDGQMDAAISLYYEYGGTDPTSQQASASTSTPPAVETDQVRAPIAPTRDVLLGDEYSPYQPQVASGRLRSNPFHQLETTSFEAFRDFSAEAEALEDRFSRQSERVQRLADLFRPPFDLMFKGDFDAASCAARAEARKEKKLLMVNIQDPSQFPCQVLNRDVWNDNQVKELVREHFVFLQYGHESPDGKKYTSFYPVEEFPYISILDPRSGELLQTWTSSMDVADFMMNVTDFLDDRERGEPQSSVRKAAVGAQPVQKNLADMTEEEQMEAAIAASMAENSNTRNDKRSIMIIDSDDEESSPRQEKTRRKSSDSEVEEITREQVQPQNTIQAIKRDEPTDPATTTRIQVRLPDGKRIVRRFGKEDPVRYLFEFVKSEVSQAADSDFEIMFNRQRLKDVMEQTIHDAGIENAAVNVII